MKVASLDGVRAKLDRAHEHLTALHAETGAFVESEAHAFRGQVQKEESRYVVRLEMREAPPIRLSILVGDLVHNLRSALDHLITQLVVLNGEKPTNRNAFPILMEPNPGALSQQLNGVDPEIVSWIETIQPYNGGQEQKDRAPLPNLRRLSNEDKHRVILASFSAIPRQDEATLRPNVRRDVEDITGYHLTVEKPLKDGDVVLWTDITVTGPNPQVDTQGALPLDIGFGAPLVTTQGLVDISDAVRGVVYEVFQPLFRACESPTILL